MVHHCGYDCGTLDDLPFVGSMAHFHDYHHKVNNKNFGVIGLCDWLHGTTGGYFPYKTEWDAESKAMELRGDQANKMDRSAVWHKSSHGNR